MLQSIDTLIAFVVIMTVASLFVTITVQMLSALLSLRGKNLANALALTFQTIDPSIGDKAHQLAAKILSDPLLSDSTMTKKDKKKAPAWVTTRKGPWNFQNIWGAAHLASAIRPEEVYAVLRRLKERKESAARLETELVTAKENLAGARGGEERETAEEHVARAKAAVGPKLSADALALRETAVSILAALERPAEDGASMTAAPVRNRVLAALDNPEARGEIDPARAKFDAWFTTAQDRAQQWFQLHTRGLTIGASILIALLLQLDAVEIFHFVSTNAAARNALVATADSVMRNADGALDERGGLIARIAAAATSPGQPAIDLRGINHVGELEAAMAKRDGEKFNPEAFAALVRQTTAEYYRDQRDRLSELTRGVSATGFEFIPIGYWRWPAGTGVQANLARIGPHLPGIALFAALLTLGAPYWFNVLKNLASLRPALARAIAQDEDEDAAKK